MLPAAALEDVSMPLSPPGSASCRRERSGSVSQPDPFDRAMEWLQRQHLGIGFSDQIRLHSMYLQATSGDVRRTSRVIECKSWGRWRGEGLARQAKMRGWVRLRGVSPEEARRRMPLALAEVDPGFAHENPRLSPAAPQNLSAAGSAAMFWLQVLAYRLPIDLDEKVSRIQTRLCVASGFALVVSACLSILPARAAGAPRKRCAWLCASTLYLAMLARGLPVWAHAKFHLQLAGVAPGPALEVPLDPVARLCRRLARFLVPRVDRSLFTDTE